MGQKINKNIKRQSLYLRGQGNGLGKTYSEDKAKKNKRGTEPGHGGPGGFTKNSGQVNKNKTTECK